MLVKWPIRVKVFVGIGLLLAMVAILSSSGLYSAYAYRTLVKTLSWRVSELPLAAEISAHVADMRVTLTEIRGLRANGLPDARPQLPSLRAGLSKQQFASQLCEVEDTLAEYSSLLDRKLQSAGSMGDNQPERKAVRRIEDSLREIRQTSSDANWMYDDLKLDELDRRVIGLQVMAVDLPTHLRSTLKGFAAEVRGQYHVLLVGLWITSAMAALVFVVFVRLFYRWIFQPLDILIRGSRKVAEGDFNYRVRLQTHDEMSELAGALNDMTLRFCTIRDDLDHQVQQRTKQVVRNEQLASVGFLAAGVAHEINNPLASIAMCARIAGRPHPRTLGKGRQRRRQPGFDHHQLPAHDSKRGVSLQGHHRKTSRFLPHWPAQAPTHRPSRTGARGDRNDRPPRQISRQDNRVAPGAMVFAPVNGQELKQVVLNLLTNALDSLGDEGRVEVRLQSCDGMAELSVADNGCGIEPEVLERVFEPFFTRRRAGQGTGLGLSICYRIVSDHGGAIEARSAGPGQGATFLVRLPLSALPAKAA